MVFIGGLFSTSVLLAGGWTGSGGDLITDEVNPWFIKDVTEVNYCIEINEDDFGASLSQVKINVRSALDYWKEEFKTFHLMNRYYGGFTNYLRIGGQDFIERPCSYGPGIDLTFKFGTTSNPEEAEFVNRSDRVIGVAVRTDYENYKAKGFIYLAPAFGEHAMPRVDTQLSNPWVVRKGRNIEWVLAHELGHVFGISHSSGFTIMMESTPATLIQRSREFLPHLPRLSRFRSFTPIVDAKFHFCNSDNYTLDLSFLEEQRKDFECLVVNVSQIEDISEGLLNIDLVGYRDLFSEPVKIGTLKRGAVDDDIPGYFSFEQIGTFYGKMAEDQEKDDLYVINTVKRVEYAGLQLAAQNGPRQLFWNIEIEQGMFRLSYLHLTSDGIFDYADLYLRHTKNPQFLKNNEQVDLRKFSEMLLTPKIDFLKMK